MIPESKFIFIAKHPAMALIVGGILLLILSPFYELFWIGGWILIVLGIEADQEYQNLPKQS